MKMFLLGILAWSLISTIFYFVYDNVAPQYDMDVVATAQGGPIFWVIVLIILGAKAIYKAYRNANCKGLISDNDGNIYWCQPSDIDLLWGYSTFHPVHVDGIKSARYAPKKVWKSYPRIPDDVIQKAKEDSESLVENW